MTPAPSLVLSLAEALALDEGSLTCASIRGGRQFIGFTEDRQLRMSIFDAINANTIATGNFGKKRPKVKPWPRPQKRKSLGLNTIAGLRKHYGL